MNLPKSKNFRSLTTKSNKFKTVKQIVKEVYDIDEIMMRVGVLDNKEYISKDDLYKVLDNEARFNLSKLIIESIKEELERDEK